MLVFDAVISSKLMHASQFGLFNIL